MSIAPDTSASPAPALDTAARPARRRVLALAATAALSLTGLLMSATPAFAAVPAPIPITSPSCPTDMQQGEIDGCVTDLQQLLNSKEGAGLTVDGDFGPATENAVETWQSNHSLSRDGIVGPQTKASLTSTSAPSGGAAKAGSVAAQNVGKTACGTNSAGGTGFYSSCTGNGGKPEDWCADFAKWDWNQGGLNVSNLSAAAVSFYNYGSSHGTLHTGSYTPKVGDVIVYGYNGSAASHVGIISAVNSDGSLVTQNGNFGGQSGNFASTSKVETATIAASAKAVGSVPSSVGQKISAYVSPVA